jgi:predicted nucleotidyltransferase
VLNRDFREFVQSLNDNQVRYLVIGGYAVALHGYPRYTKDIDIWIEPTPANLEKVLNALVQFGFGSLELRVEDFLAPDQVVQLGHPPNRIDLITAAPGVDFATCHRTRVEVPIDGVKVAFIDLSNLRKNTKAAGRLQDLADLENLQDPAEGGP